MAIDNTCFGYTQKTVHTKEGIKIIEQCTPLHCGDCDKCKFYKPPHVLQHDKAMAELRNRKVISGVYRIRYSLNVNGRYEGEFESIEEIDKWLFRSKYNTNGELDVPDIYKNNIITIRRVEL